MELFTFQCKQMDHKGISNSHHQTWLWCADKTNLNFQHINFKEPAYERAITSIINLHCPVAYY